MRVYSFKRDYFGLGYYKGFKQHATTCMEHICRVALTLLCLHFLFDQVYSGILLQHVSFNQQEWLDQFLTLCFCIRENPRIKKTTSEQETKTGKIQKFRKKRTLTRNYKDKSPHEVKTCRGITCKPSQLQGVR